MRLALKCSPCPDASNDVQHDLGRSHFDLDLRSKMKLTFRGYGIYSSIRLDKTRWYLYYCCTYQNEKVIRGQRLRSKTAFLLR